MKKKLFDRSALQSLNNSHKPHLNRTTDRLRHALIGHRLVELFGATLAYGWWLRLEQFIEEVRRPWNEQVVPLCLFKPEAGGSG